MSQIADDISELFYDPYGFILYVFPWGEAELEDEEIEDWQRKVLVRLGEELKSQTGVGGVIRMAVKSGHGVGKSCLMSWLILFFIVTRPDIQIIATANTDSQLRTKLWREVAKWHKKMIPHLRHQFEWTATQLKSLENPEDWYATAIPWNENNPEAMAGAHEKTVLYLFDESSGIHPVIWETAEGAMTDGGGVLMAFGNPTQNTGAFYECFNKFAKFWITDTVNCEKVKRVDKKTLEDWREIYGEDSDFYRIRCLGEFPKHGTRQFIPLELVEEAVARRLPPEAYEGFPITIGVDVARYGADKTVFTLRQGPKLILIETHQGIDTQKTGMRAAQFINKHSPDGVFIDDVGIGAGVTDYLMHAGFREVMGVNGSRKSRYPDLHRNMRGDCWEDMKEWIGHADIPNNDDLIRDLTVIEYSFDTKMRFILDSKEDLRKRGERSPDLSDSLALTFAAPVSEQFFEMEEDIPETVGASQVTGY